MRKIGIFIAAVTMILCGCSAEAGLGGMDYGSYKDYESELAYEVKSEDGQISEQMYYLFRGEYDENTVPNGTKDVFFDENGKEVVKYTVTIGTDTIDELVTYATGNDETVYYSEMYFDDGELARAVWDNQFLGENGKKIRQKGEETYYPESGIKKHFIMETYIDGELNSTSEKDYNENGEVISEKDE